MVITNYRLPQIERVTLKSLDDDDETVLAAFEIVFTGYRKAQKRARALTKAYNELESLTLRILDDLQKTERTSRSSRSRSLLVENNATICANSSSPMRATSSESASRRNDERTFHNDTGTENTIEMIDLTSLFDVNAKQQNPSERESPRRETIVEKVATTSTGGKSRVKEKGIESVKENEPPTEVEETSTRRSQESRTRAKLGLAKVALNAKDSRTTSQRSASTSKQSTLILQPIARKIDLASLKNRESPEKSRGDGLWGNLFDENYRATRQRETSRPEARLATSPTRSSEAGDRDVSKPSLSSPIRLEAIASASGINETARSLFDDEDNFQSSPDILNTCAEPSDLEVNLSQTKVEPNYQPGAATSARIPRVAKTDTIDETFFAPAEIPATCIESGPSSFSAPTRVDVEIQSQSDDARPGKRKSRGDTDPVDGDEDADVLALQDINWDVEMSDDDWNSSAERPPINSFHVPPEKRNKTPQFACKEKVERNKAKRSKLRGWNCWQCEKYYGNMQLSEDELRKRMDACSRHRGKFNPRYCTPKDFWNPEFPETTDSSDCSQS